MPLVQAHAYNTLQEVIRVGDVLEEFHLGESSRRCHRLLWTACVRFICLVGSFAGVTCTFPARWLVVYEILRILMLALARLLQDYGMLAPPSAALLLIDVTAQQDDSSASRKQRGRIPGSWTRECLMPRLHGVERTQTVE